MASSKRLECERYTTLGKEELFINKLRHAPRDISEPHQSWGWGCTFMLVNLRPKIDGGEVAIGEPHQSWGWGCTFMLTLGLR